MKEPPWFSRPEPHRPLDHRERFGRLPRAKEHPRQRLVAHHIGSTFAFLSHRAHCGIELSACARGGVREGPRIGALSNPEGRIVVRTRLGLASERREDVGEQRFMLGSGRCFERCTCVALCGLALASRQSKARYKGVRSGEGWEVPKGFCYPLLCELELPS